MSWHKYVITAMGELHPGASPLTDYLWVQNSLEAIPEMIFWNEEKLGPLDLSALQAAAEEIMARPVVPKSVTRAQALMALFNAGLLDDLEAIIAAHPYRPVRIWFENANEWLRTNPYVNLMGPELGLTDEGIDNLFIEAARL